MKCWSHILTWLCWAWLATGYGQTAGEITNFTQLRRLPSLALGETRPLRLKGVVVCHDAGWHQLYIHDGEETGFFNADDFAAQPALGQWVEITGTTRGSNHLGNLKLQLLHQGTLPAARHLEIFELAQDHGEWVETTGRVLSAETSRGRLALVLADQGRNCLAYILGTPPPRDFKRWLDCRVRLRGINASKVSGDRLESAALFVPGLEEITVLEPAPAKSEAVPVISIGSLLNRELGPWTNNRVRINGLVVSYQPGRNLVIKDPTGVISAQVIQQTEIRGDERVDVWGFLDASQENTFLANAYFEVVQPPTEEFPGVAQDTGNLPRAPAEVLTEILQVQKLRREEAALRKPVRLQGVITYADPEWRNGFLQVGGAAIYVDLDPALKQVQSGQWVELTGHTSPGGFAPEVASSNIVILHATNLPPPVRVDLEDLANGHLDAHWVEMEGVVRRVEAPASHISLSVMTPKGRFKVILPNPQNRPPPTHLIDALIRVQGACTSELNVRRQLSGITLHVPGLEHVKVLELPPPDPFAIATTPIAAVATFDPDRLAGRRVKVQGAVTMRLPGQGFLLQDGSGGLRVLTRQTNEITVGDWMSVLGFTAIGDFSPYLEEAVFRSTGSGLLPVRKQTTAEQILLHGTNDAQVVELEARLLQSVPRSANPQLVLQDGPIIFTAQFVTQNPRKQVPALPSGCLLRLTGVCSIQGGEGHEPEAFRLLLHQPEDVVLLETAPWWTSRRALMVAGGMGLAIAGAFAWVVLLRRQVSTQTKLIRQKLEDEASLKERFRELFENANDMVYTHDPTGRLTSINQTGEDLLQRPRAEILGRNLLEMVAGDQRVAARQWLENVLHGTDLPAMEWDFLAASGKRVKVEISTRLIRQGGRLVEVEGIARDITERKRLEREILEISNREQRRIGHDLHDGVCQQLAGIAFLTSTLAEELQEKSPTSAPAAERISSLINGVVNQTRSVARGLFPVRLEENGLLSALEELAVNAGELFNLQCRFVAEEPPPEIDHEIALHLYYIVLEAVANAAKHGKARAITISLDAAGDNYALNVHDDGIGFHPGAHAQSGMGIRIMHYRARVISATLNLRSHPDSGTDVTCVFRPLMRTPSPPAPLPDEAAADVTR